MLKIKLLPKGPKGNPTFRIAVMEQRKKRGGKYIACLGFWHKAKNKKVINEKKLDYWLSKGAKPTLALKRIFQF